MKQNEIILDSGFHTSELAYENIDGIEYELRILSTPDDHGRRSFEVIGVYVSGADSSLTEIHVPASVCMDSYKTKSPNGIGTFPVDGIAPRAFKNTSRITKVEIPDTLLTIDKSAFQNCSSLKEINTYFAQEPKPNRGERKGLDIDKQAFKGCSALETVILHVGYVMNDAFAHCYNLRRLHLTTCTSDADNDIVKEAFNGCIALTDVKITDEFGKPSLCNVSVEEIFTNCPGLNISKIAL